MRAKKYSAAYQAYDISPTEVTQYSYELFFNAAKLELTRTIGNALTELKGLKFKLSYLGYFVMNGCPLERCEDQKQEKNFKSSVYEITSHHEIHQDIESAFTELKTEISEFQDKKSGWVFYENRILFINIYKYVAIRGGSNTNLPAIIANKKACINIKNKDEKCFLYSVIAHGKLAAKNSERVSKYEPYVKDYAGWKHEYPMKLKDISKFEKQFNLSINVYGYEIKKDAVEYHPLHLTQNLIRDAKGAISLLLMKEGEKSHYVLIKSMSALMHKNYNGKGKGTVHLCPCCFRVYKTLDKLNEHLRNGCAKFGECTSHPVEAKEYAKFKSYHKMLKKPFVIYSDFEAIFVETEAKAKATKKYQSHVACGYAYKRLSIVKEHDKDIVLFRGESKDINVAEHFIDRLLEEADEVTAIMKNIIPMNLTDTQKQEHKAADTCYLCEKGYHEKDWKVRDHDHLTGEYRGAAHNSCHLRYGFKNYKIPVFFHNLKGYDSHFIVKALNKKLKRIACIPSSTEKFISFSVNNLEFIDSMSFIQASGDIGGK